jgi:Tfp pilus assembly protein PilF
MEADFAQPHEDLGMLHLARGQAQIAVDLFEKAVALDANASFAYRGLATALKQVGRLDEAQAAQQAFLDQSPSSRALSRATTLHASGDSQQAEKICEDILKREPQNTAALRLLAVIASDDERHVVAEGLLRRIVKLAPSNVAAIRELGRFLADRNRFPESIELLEQAEKMDDSNAQVKLMLGDMYTIVGQTSAALKCYETCLAIAPQEPLALLGRGHMLRITGKREQAESSYRKCIEVQADIGDAWWSLASLHGYRASDAEVTHMQALIDTGNLHRESEAAMRFAMARACEERHDFAAAWQEYERANRIKRSLVSYDPVEVEVRHDKMIEVFTDEFFERVFEEERPTSPPSARTSRPTPCSSTATCRRCS